MTDGTLRSAEEEPQRKARERETSVEYRGDEDARLFRKGLKHVLHLRRSGGGHQKAFPDSLRSRAAGSS